MTVPCRRPVIGALSALALLVSCSDYNAPVKDYLEEYSSSAAVGYHQILVPSEKDAAGIDSIASNADGVIRFFLRNPRSYDISSNIVLDDGTLLPAVGTDYHLNLSADRQSISLTFTDEFLRAHDGEQNGDLSGTLTMSDAYRTFPSWHFNLRSNTPPPAPYASRVMLEPEAEPGDRYVLCFNLDLRNGVQDDIASITVNGNVFAVTGVTAGDTQAISFASASPLISLSTTPPAGTLRPVGELQPFAVDDGMTQVYFRTGIEASALVESRFTITVRDSRGLSRSAITTTKGEMLVQPEIRNRNNESPASGALSLPPEADGSYHVFLSHTVPGTTLHWSIDGGATQSSPTLPYDLTIPADCTLKVWASKSGFVNSDPVTADLHRVTNVYYVDPTNPNADDLPTYGSQSRPFRTITYAVTRFSEPEDEDNTVYLMGDITGKEAEDTYGCVSIAPPANLTCTIEGLGANRTITDDDGEDCRGLHIYASDTINITLRNLTITGCSESLEGGGIYFSAISGSRLIVENCIVSNNRVYSGNAAVQGGGIFFSGSELIVRGSDVFGNFLTTTASNATNGLAKGAGIFASGVVGSSASVTIESSSTQQSRVRNNIGGSGFIGSGGGIYVTNASLFLSDNTNINDNIANDSTDANSVGQGGGILLFNATGSMEDDVVIRNNCATKTDKMGTGGGIRIDNNSGTRTFTMNGGQILANYAGRYSDANSYGGGIYAAGLGGARVILNLASGLINGNYAIEHGDTGSAGAGYGGGVYAASTTTVNLQGTSITDNWASHDQVGYGGGICMQTVSTYSSVLNMNSGTLSGNIASQTNQGSGGGLYLDGNITATMSSTVADPLNIESNYASLTGEGNGGGIYVKGQATTQALTLTMNGGNVSGNTASAENNGQGGACFVGAYATVTSDSSTVTVSHNYATRSGGYEGFGGAFFVSANGNVTWNTGTISENQGNTNNSSRSYGEAFRMNNTAIVTLKTALGNNGGNTGNAIDMTGASQLNLHPNFRLYSNANNKNRIFWNGGGTINCKEEYLYTNEIPLLVGGLSGDQIVSEGSRANYYKFLVDNGENFCINANGRYSPVNNLDTARDYTSFTSLLSPLVDGEVTYQVKFLNMTTFWQTATIPSGVHVRIIPQNSIEIYPNTTSLFVVEGHLLLGNPAQETTIQCNSAPRAQPLILMVDTSSLVLRNVDVRNSRIASTTEASLIDASAVVPKTIVLDDFTYNDTTSTPFCGSTAALYLENLTVCHFVSGSIRRFVTDGAGAAYIGSSSHLYLHPGTITFEGNSLIDGSSIEGAGYPGNLHNLGGYLLPTK